MICRKIQFVDQEPMGLMISQIEHARISGLLAEHCLSHLDKSLRVELTQAIIHHDDGWAEWEASPQLDETNHRPLSFYELTLEDSLEIWTNSIRSAKEYGPRAAWVVASHFAFLLDSSKESNTSSAEKWRDQLVVQCKQWRRVWRSSREAKEAWLWLRLLDVMSLWLCSVCPCQDEQASQLPKSYHVGKGQLLEAKFSYDQGRMRITPWRFDVPSLEVEAEGWLVPIQEYSSSDELLAARVACKRSWTLSS